MIEVNVEPQSPNSAGYTELLITDFGHLDGLVEITFRKYPKRIFAAYSDDTGNPCVGVDLDDLYCAPTIITEKTLHAEFDLSQALTIICKKIYGQLGESIAINLLHYCKPIWDDIMLGNIHKAKEQARIYEQSED